MLPLLIELLAARSAGGGRSAGLVGLVSAHKECLDAMASFRKFHLGIATKYLVRAQKGWCAPAIDPTLPPRGLPIAALLCYPPPPPLPPRAHTYAHTHVTANRHGLKLISRYAPVGAG